MEITSGIWTVVPPTDAVREKVTKVIELISEVVKHATTTNLPPGARALTELERNQLITVLRTALKILEAPMTEKGFLNKTVAFLKDAAAKGAAKQVEMAMSAASLAAVAELTGLIDLL